VIRHFLILLCSCLLLVCCDKPARTDARKDESATTARKPGRGHAQRETNNAGPASLRSIYGAALAIESPETREKALADVAWSALETDPYLAHQAFLKLPADSPGKIRLIQHYAMRLAEQSPDEALAWAETLGTEQEIAAANGIIAVAIAETDPQRAANLLSETGIVGREFEVTLVQVIQRWAAQSPQEAGTWVSSFPVGAARAAGVRVIAGQWLQRDARAAFDWLGGMKDAELRKETARAMEGIILQQPRDIREAWLQHADASIHNELKQQLAPAIEDVGDNIPPPQP
jgi:hypothetical protein